MQTIRSAAAENGEKSTQDKIYYNNGRGVKLQATANMTNKRNSFLLLFGVGISSLGDFIYIIAINIFVLKLTGSAAAVAGLWIIGPIAAILTKFWSGSIIDRANKRELMILTDFIRALVVAIIPILPSIWLIYVCLFFLSAAKAFFEPASVTYITSIIPRENRKQFNALRSFVTSGALVVGPAIAGALLMFTTANAAIWINAVSFAVSAFMLFLLPNVEKSGNHSQSITLKVLMNDWKQVLSYSKKHSYIAAVFFLGQFFWIIALGMDAQEVVFIEKVVGLTETDYGLLVSITGIGYLVGSSALSYFSRRLSIKLLLGLGYVMVAAGYIIYAFSTSFLLVAIGFIVLGFFNSFSNAGLVTFYQNNVPVEIMGRISSVFGTIQSILQIGLVLLIGFSGELFPLRYSMIFASILIFCSSILLVLLVCQRSKESYYREIMEEVSL
ncbi:MFS transporter [Neobacillus dielmonensis]|uniref:MFS transporter n=1 Tax=Neobacillus dielmonensis TaxID=1347369 RepID=UPI000ABAE008|nr:MFS transporter [Neobacillus dielmonensis]